MRLTNRRESISEEVPDGQAPSDSTAARQLVVRQLVKLRLATAVLVAAVVIDHARADVGLAVVIGLAGAILIGLSAALPRKHAIVNGSLSLSLASFDCLIVLTVLALVGAASSDAVLLILALPLVHVAVAVGVGAMSVLWVAASFAVMSWNVLTWDGGAQPVTEAALTLVILWMVAYVSGLVASVLAQRALDYFDAAAAAGQRSDVLRDTLLGCMTIVRAADGAAQILCAETAKLTDGETRIGQGRDRSLNRELVARAKRANGAAVVGRDAKRNVHLAVSVGRDRYLVVVAPADTNQFQIDAVELLCLQFRTLQASGSTPSSANRRRATDPASASLAEALDTSILDSASPLAALDHVTRQVPSLLEALADNENALATSLLNGPVP